MVAYDRKLSINAFVMMRFRFVHDILNSVVEIRMKPLLTIHIVNKGTEA